MQLWHVSLWLSSLLSAKDWGVCRHRNGSASGAIASAKVTVTEAGTGYARTTTSAEGSIIPHPCPAEYNLSVDAPGFRTSAQSGIVLGADQKAR